MSKAADLNNDEYKSANGSPEKKIGDTVINKDEEEESDVYEDDDEVCVQGYITNIWELNPFWQEQEGQIAEEDEGEDEGEGVCICAQSVFMYSTSTHIIYRDNKTRSPTSFSEK